MKEDFLALLLDMVTNDKDCQVKAMYAISCIIRECPLAQEKFLSSDYNGPSVIMNATMSSGAHEKLRVKASFFISSLCQVKKFFLKRIVILKMSQPLIKHIKNISTNFLNFGT